MREIARVRGGAARPGGLLSTLLRKKERPGPVRCGAWKKRMLLHGRRRRVRLVPVLEREFQNRRVLTIPLRVHLVVPLDLPCAVSVTQLRNDSDTPGRRATLGAYYRGVDEPLPRAERPAAIIVGAVIAAIIATLLLAPMITGGYCNDSSDPAKSVCGTIGPQTLAGWPISVWPWAAALVVIATVAIALVLRAARRRA